MNLKRVTPHARRASGGALTDAELFALEDHELVAYMAKARGAGNRDGALAATHILLHKHEDRMRHRVALRLPEHLWHHAPTVADWVLEKVMRSALKLAFEGESIGEWVNWWTRAINRQVISFWRSRQGQALAAEVEFPEEREGHEDERTPRRPQELRQDFDADALLSGLVRDETIGRVLDGMGNEKHVAIIELAIFQNRPSKEVAERFDTTATNVDKIKSRFKQRLKEDFQSQGIETL